MSTSTAAEHWARELAAWAIPGHIMDRAPESPWAFSPKVFRPPDGPTPDTVSRVRARDALAIGGSVLDVGCGGGAAGLALVPPAGRVTGFDQSLELLDLFAAKAVELGVAHQAVQGSWPDHADLVGPADVVVCHHVAYNVADLAPFARELTHHARVRVVVELTGRHPRFALNPVWQHFWADERPTGPTADDAVAVLVEAGIELEVERSPRPGRNAAPSERVESARRYLCLPAERDAEIETVLADHPIPPDEIVTLSWPGTASGEVGAMVERAPRG